MSISNTIQQLSVFLENREGRLDEVLEVLAAKQVNIVALSLADTSDYGMLRMIVSRSWTWRSGWNTSCPCCSGFAGLRSGSGGRV